MPNIDDIEFTIFDTETTGLEPTAGDRIVEIAAVRFKGQKRIAIFETLVNPRRSISLAAFQVNRITPQMLEGAPGFEAVANGFLNFVRGSCLCSYNAGFDLEFLNHELGLAGRKLPGDTVVLDILKMARKFFPGLERYALWFVADKLGIRASQQHRALSDVELTLGVFNRLKEIAKYKGVFDFSHFLGLFSINPVYLDNINNQKIAQIQKAIQLGVKLRIKYLSSAGAEVSERAVIPKEVRQENRHSYLVAHCCLKNDERTFRVDGILHLEIL